VSASDTKAGQAMAQMQFISNVVDLKMNLQAALEAPRFSRRGSECGLAAEVSIPAEVLEGLRKKGQILQAVFERWGGETGMRQAVLWDSRSKTQYAAWDPGADGAAIPEALPWR